MKPGRAPTPLVDPSERPPIRIAPVLPVRARSLRILLAIAGWLLRSAVARILGRFRPEENARRVRETMERLGFLSVKLGQILSLRTDIFSREFCDEVSKLQHRASGFDVQVSRRVIERELGGPIERFFSSFEEMPFAAASISQLHRARLREEDAEVVVKVMRPDAPRVFQTDLAFVARLVRLANRFERFARFRFDEGLWELSEIAKEEVDYRFELTNLRRFRESVRRHGVYVPKAYPRYSTRQVLVMERVDGELMSDVLLISRSDPARVERWFAENEIDPRKVGRKLVLSFLRQLLEENLFHGDLHPGNILLLRGNRVTLIDLGTLGTADQDLVRRYYYSLKAIASNEFQKGVEHILAFSSRVPAGSYVDAKEDMVRVVRSWAARTYLDTLPYHAKSLSQLFVAVVDVMAHHGVPTSWGLLRMDRAVVTMDASIATLAPDLGYQELLREYHRKRGARRARQVAGGRALAGLLLEAPEIVDEYRLFLDAPIRRVSPAFSAEMGKVSTLVLFLLNLFSTALFVIGVFLVVTFLHQHHGFLRGTIENDWLEIAQDSAEDIPFVEDELWVLAILFDLYLLGAIRRLKKKFAQKDIHLPGASAAT